MVESLHRFIRTFLLYSHFKNLTHQRTEGGVENWYTVNSKSLFQPLLEGAHNLNAGTHFNA